MELGKFKVKTTGNTSRNSTQNNIKITKTLYSPFVKEVKPFKSMFLFKQKNILVNNDPNSIKAGPFGPLIVTHREDRTKVKMPPKKYRLDEDRPGKYNYFENHKDCKETKYYWTNLQHPKILRHFN